MKTHTTLEGNVGSDSSEWDRAKKGIRNTFLAILAGVIAACVPTQTRPILDGTPTEKTQAYTQTSADTTISELGISTGEPTYQPTETLEPTPSATMEPTATNKPELYTLSLQAFHDYNGNGTMEEGEPALEGIVNKTSAGECTTGVEGKCMIQNLPAGDYNIAIQAPSNFKYVTPNIEKDLIISNGLDIKVDGDATLIEPLVEGPYRSPFRDIQRLVVHQWKDINIASCWGNFPDRFCDLRADWSGGKNTYDGHDGTDFKIGDNVEVYAMREGQIYSIKQLDNNEGYAIKIKDLSPYMGIGNSFQMFYHVNTLTESLEVGQIVTPETLLGVGGSEKIGGTLHVGIFHSVPSNNDPEGIEFQINPYAKCPFQEKLWTGIAALSSTIVVRDELSGAYSTIHP